MKTMTPIKTKQARSLKTQENILDATERLLMDAEFGDLSLQQIAREAGVTTGAIYARFANKAELLNILLDRYAGKAARALEAFLEQAANAPPEEVAGLLVTIMFDLFTSHKGVVRTALHTDPSSVNSPYLKDVATLYERARQELEAAAMAMGNKSPKTASMFALTLMISACREQVVINEKARFFDIDPELFTQELTHILRCYLKS